jgi:hypothetical protein
LAVAFKVDDLRFVAAAQLTRPLDIEALRAKLHATTAPDEPDRLRFKLDPPSPFGAHGYLRVHAEQRLLILAFNPRDLDQAPTKPIEDAGQFPPALQTLLRERMDKSAEMWIAGHAEQWDRTLAALWLANLPEPSRKALGQVRTFGLWAKTGDPLLLNAAVECADEPGAQALRAYLEKWTEARLPGSKVIQDATWVSAQAKPSEAELKQAFGHE